MAEKLEYDFLVKGGEDGNQLAKSLDKASKKSLDLESIFESAVGVFAGNVLTEAFDLVVDGIQGIVNITGEAIDAAAGQETATNNLNAALARSGNLTRETTAELAAYATQLQATSKFEDDAALSALALLQSLTKLDKDGLKSGVSAAADFATVLGVDLETATRLVAKAAEGNVEAFKRYGIEIKKGASDSESFKNTIEALNKSFGGAAQSQLNTYSGSLVALNNAYSDLLEPIGDIVVKNPIVIGLFSALKDTINDLNGFIGQNNSSFKELVSDGIFATIAAAKALAQALSAVTVVSKILVGSIEVLVGSFNFALFGSINLVLKALNELTGSIPFLGKAVAQLQSYFSELTKGAGELVTDGLDVIKKSSDQNIFGELANGADAFADKLINASEKVKSSDEIYKNSNKAKVADEAATSNEILNQRAQLNADLLSLQIQLANEQKRFDDELNLLGIEDAALRNEEQIFLITEQKLRENEAVLAGELAKAEIIKEESNKQLAIQKANAAKLLADSKVNADKEIALKKQIRTEEEAIFKGRLAAANSFAELGLALSKDGSNAAKGIASANAILNTYAGANQVLADPTIPVPAKPAFIAAAIATGLANVAKINAIKFEQGGFVGGMNGASAGPDNRTANVRDGEMFLNAQQQKTLLDFVNGAGGNQPIIVQIDGREIARAYRDQLKQGFVA